MSQAALPIVVGVDDSDQARAALDWALAEAQRRQAPLVVAHAWHPGSFATPSLVGSVPDWTQADLLLKDAEANAQRWLDDVVADSIAVSGVAVAGELGEGSAAGHLINLGEDAQLVVVGSRGRGGLRGLLLGSTSHQVASHCTSPVVVLRGEDDSKPSGPVVVGVDGSPASDVALTQAFAEARVRGVQLVILHAWSTSYAGTLATTGEQFDDVRESERDEGWRTLNESLCRLREEHGSVEVDERLEQGSPAAALVDASKGASLVVVGSRGRGGFKGLLLGSVSASVLQHAHAPVMVVRT